MDGKDETRISSSTSTGAPFDNGPVARPTEVDATEQSVATEAAKHSALATHADPSITGVPVVGDPRRAQHGVTWVRPTELIARGGARAAGCGIDFHAELARRLRARTGEGVRHARRSVADRRRRLPDLSLGGRDYPMEEVTQELSGMGRR